MNFNLKGGDSIIGVIQQSPTYSKVKRCLQCWDQSVLLTLGSREANHVEGSWNKYNFDYVISWSRRRHDRCVSEVRCKIFLLTNIEYIFSQFCISFSSDPWYTKSSGKFLSVACLDYAAIYLYNFFRLDTDQNKNVFDGPAEK